MDFTTLQTALQSWVAARSGLESAEVRWFDREQATTSARCAMLSIGPTRAVHVDDLRYEPDPEGSDGIVPTVNGIREFTLSVSLETRNAKPDNTGSTGRKARHYAEQLRTSLCLPSVLAGFQAAHLAVVRSHDVIEVPVKSNGRVKSTAVLDVTFSTRSILADAVDDYFDKITMDTTLSGVDGDPLPASLQQTDTEIP